MIDWADRRRPGSGPGSSERSSAGSSPARRSAQTVGGGVRGAESAAQLCDSSARDAKGLGPCGRVRRDEPGAVFVLTSGLTRQDGQGYAPGVTMPQQAYASPFAQAYAAQPAMTMSEKDARIAQEAAHYSQRGPAPSCGGCLACLAGICLWCVTPLFAPLTAQLLRRGSLDKRSVRSRE